MSKAKKTQITKMTQCLFNVFKTKKKNNVAVIRLVGAIGKVSHFSSGLSSEGIDYIDRVSKIKNLKAIVLVINSPGGSPVQSELMAKKLRSIAEIKDKKTKKKRRVPIYSFCEDVAASGGYWLALAGDELYASKSSVIGSIGVISAGFGFTELINKIGVERRVYSQGKNKSVLDPFQKEKEADIKLIKELQKDVHDAFIDYVKERRGKKIKAKDEDIFNGKFWGGAQAHTLGLIDGIAYYPDFIRDKFGDDVEFKNITPKQGFLKRKFSAGTKFQTESFLHSCKEYVDELFIWNRYGL